MRRSSFLGCFWGALLAPLPALALVTDPNFEETPYATVVADASVTSMAFAPDDSGRLFIAKKQGELWIVQNGVALAEPFAVVSPTWSANECGLLGVAFDPDFVTNGFVYVFVTVSVAEQRILRYRADGNVGRDETVIVGGLPTRGENHDGGALAFGPDGKLYFAIGDLSYDVGHGDDLVSLGSKLGRVNRDGSAPEDNPFADGPGPNHELIYARGLRNPFTMTFQPTTGLPWVNVVGTAYEQVFALGAGDNAGYPTYENVQPAGYRAPVLAYGTNRSDVLSVVSVERVAGTVTATTSTPHGLHPGGAVTLAGVSDPGLDGDAFVAEIPADTAFRFEQPGADTVATGGSVSTLAIGGCITGGTFYDSSAGSAEYRDDFFFGDYNTGRLVRARVSGSGVQSVRLFGEHRRVVDMAVGPDGDLYYVTHSGTGQVLRARFRAQAQGLVVSSRHALLVEGGAGLFQVRLAEAPASPVVVAVRRASGDDSVRVTAGRTLTFDAIDWARPQPVWLAAARDEDTRDDMAVLVVSADGVPDESVTVRVHDEWTGELPEGAGGEGGEGGVLAEGGGGADAGTDPGSAGAARGGRGQGGVAGRASGGGVVTGGSVGAGEGGEGGDGAGALGTAGSRANGGRSGAAGETGRGGTGQRGARAAGGCGCSTAREPKGASLGLLVALALLEKARRRNRARR